MMKLRIGATRLAAAFMVATAAASGCTARHGSPADQAVVPEQVVLEVENRNWSDVVLYVIHDGRSTRFITITAAKTDTVPIAPRFIGSNGVVRFIAHRVGGYDDYYSPTVSIRTGNTIALTLQPELNMSSIGVW